MSKEELIKKLDHDTYNHWCLLQVYGLSEQEAADALYEEGYICYWERDILKGE